MGLSVTVASLSLSFQVEYGWESSVCMCVCGSVCMWVCASSLVVASLTWKQSLFLAITGSVFGLFCVTELVVFFCIVL